jgi:tRNA U34 2-thiouridine synthase MnmA/TrmU
MCTTGGPEDRRPGTTEDPRTQQTLYQYASYAQRWQRSHGSGQAAVFYDGDRVLGRGWIDLGPAL